ncbi:TIM barrel protein [Arthrobacter sp. 2MCAF15]|uniref:TIM barrel protein n=1 Tax=Arthrobacter sp. 2MCAF15 TaxID=3232984 RepID=UPI003F8E4A6F
MLTLTANLELNFPDIADVPSRIEAAKTAGLDEVDIWTTSDKDLPAIKSALDATGTRLVSILAEPRMDIVWPNADLEKFLSGLERSIEDARFLECPFVIVDSGLGFPGQIRRTQLDRLAEIYAIAVDRVRGSGITILLESVNTRVDHPGLLLDRNADCMEIIRTVNDPSLRWLFDAYHSFSEGEDYAKEFAAGADLVEYVHLADAPGRKEPGTGVVDWSVWLDVIEKNGYSGSIGLEFTPTTDFSSSVAYFRSLVEARNLALQA